VGQERGQTAHYSTHQMLERGDRQLAAAHARRRGHEDVEEALRHYGFCSLVIDDDFFA
jgi:hypothetical protein